MICHFTSWDNTPLTMLAKYTFSFILASLLFLLACVSATPPSAWSQGSRNPGYWTRPGQHRPQTHDHENPYSPHRPGYPQRPGYPHRHGYPPRPGYPDSHDVYPGEDCRYGRPCGRPVDEDDDIIDDEDSDFGGYDDYNDRAGQLGCSCLLYVEHTVVFRRVNRAQRFSCNRYGLERCSRYCDELFQEEGIRASSRQDACDVLGREIHTPWYRKDQVCGSGGPYQDTPMEIDLCCRRGRPSLFCDED